MYMKGDEKMYLWVYAIKHNKTGRIYIGASSNPIRRMNIHLSKLRCGKHSVELMQEDFDKYGEDYSFYKLDEIHSKSERYKENVWQVYFNTRVNGYNYKDNFKNYKLNHFKEIKLYWEGGGKVNPLITLIKTEMVRNGRDDFIKYLAEILDISIGWASSKLSGKSKFTDSEISKLNEVLNFDAEELKSALVTKE